MSNNNRNNNSATKQTTLNLNNQLTAGKSTQFVQPSKKKPSRPSSGKSKPSTISNKKPEVR